MPLFNFRKSAIDGAPSAQPESVETLRRRARHRLIGAVVLVAIGVAGFPILFDTQPRSVAVDLDIEIPDKATAKPMAVLTPQRGAASGSGTASGVTRPLPAPVTALPASSAAKPATQPTPTNSRVAAAASLDAKEEVISSTSEPKQPTAQVDTAQAAIKKEAASKPKPEPMAERNLEPKTKREPAADDGAKARALLEGRSPEAASAASVGRFIVQVGTFADPDKALETRLKVEKAGLKTYTHVAETKDGSRTRVRVGPFASRAEADKAAERIKALDLPAAILTL